MKEITRQKELTERERSLLGSLEAYGQDVHSDRVYEKMLGELDELKDLAEKYNYQLMIEVESFPDEVLFWT